MKSSAVTAGSQATAEQYNNLRGDAQAASFLLAHEQSTPDMTLYVEAGVAFIRNTKVEYAGGNTPTITAPVSNNRIDLIVINSAGTISVVTGTAAASPSAPSYPGDKAVICEVYVRSTSTTLRDTDGGAATGYIRKDVRPYLIANAITQDGGQIFTADSGTNDAYVLTLDPAPAALYNGMVVRFRAGTANTGNATLNVNGLGAKNILKNFNTALSDSDIKAGQMVEVVYDSAQDAWQIFATAAAGAADIQSQAGNYAADGEASDTYAITLSPAPAAYAAGLTIRFKANTANTGPATLNVNSLGAKDIKKYQNTALETGDILANQIVEVVYDGTNFLLLSPIAKPMGLQWLDSVSLGSAAATLTTNTFTAKKHLQIRIYVPGNTTASTRDLNIRFNGDTGNNYAVRYSDDGGADTTAASQSLGRVGRIYATANPSPTIVTLDVINVLAEEKHWVGQASWGAADGAAAAPSRTVTTGKWANTAAQITSVTIVGVIDNLPAGSSIVVFGRDE